MHFDPVFKTYSLNLAVYWKSEETAAIINYENNLNYFIIRQAFKGQIFLGMEPFI